jgi:hypothetical protein
VRTAGAREIFPIAGEYSLPEIRAKLRHTLCQSLDQTRFLVQEGAMTHTNVLRGIVGIFEHALIALVGFVLMVIGLGLSVTMIMLPVGLVIGLLGFGMFVGGLVVHMNES